MKAKKKLYLLRVQTTWKNDEGIEESSIDTYIGTISPMDRNKYFEGAWFDEDNQFVGSVSLSKEQFNTEIKSCKELTITLSDSEIGVEK